MVRNAAMGLAILLVCSLAAGQDTQPAREAQAGPVEDQPQQVTVASVVGRAQRLLATGEEPKWVELKEGDVLDEMTIVRTGLRGKVVLRFADRGELTVNNATKVGIGEFRKRGNLARARLGLKYGTIRAKVETGRGPNDFEVSTPVATLSVKGSGADVSALVDSPLIVQTFTGAWTTTTPAGQTTTHAGEATNNTLAQWAEIAQQQRDTRMAAIGQTPVEIRSLIANRGGRGILGPAPSNSNPGGPLLPLGPLPPSLWPPCPPPPVPPPYDRAAAAAR